LVATTLARTLRVIPRCGKPALEQEHEARAHEEQQDRVCGRGRYPKPSQPGGSLVFGDGHRVDLAHAAVIEVAGVGVVEAVLAAATTGRE